MSSQSILEVQELVPLPPKVHQPHLLLIPSQQTEEAGNMRSAGHSPAMAKQKPLEALLMDKKSHSDKELIAHSA